MILHLETATKVCSVALSNEGRLLAEKSSNTEHYSHAENLTVFIEEVIKLGNIEFKDLNAISVSSGPGSYTGLRVGVSTAKALCYALEIPLIGIDSLVSIAAQMQEKWPNKKLLPMIDARRMEVFCALYYNNLKTIRPISAEIIDESSFSDIGEFVIAGDGIAKLKEIWGNRNEIIFENEILSNAKGQVNIAFEKYKKEDFEDVAYFEPFYLKEFK